MKFQFKFFPLILPVVLFTFLTGESVNAKTCTEVDIRNAVTANRPFVYKTEGCTNANGIIAIKSGIPITISGWKFDGSNIAHLTWKGTGACDRYPRMGNFAFFNITGSNNMLTSFIAEGAPEGIHVERGDGNIIDNVTFPIVCEKAIRNGDKSTLAATNTIVRNSRFLRGLGPADHDILVQGGSITVSNSYFKKPRAAIASCAQIANPGFHPELPCYVPSKITAIGNQVDGCDDYGMRGAGKGTAAGGFLIAQNNTFSNCKTPLLIEESGYVDAGGNIFNSSCDQGLLSRSSTATGLYRCNNKNSCTNQIAGPGIKKAPGC